MFNTTELCTFGEPRFFNRLEVSIPGWVGNLYRAEFMATKYMIGLDKSPLSRPIMDTKKTLKWFLYFVNIYVLVNRLDYDGWND